MGLLESHGLRFSNYQFSFASAVTCGQDISVDIKDSHLRLTGNTTLSNRVSVKKDGKLALIGYKRESRLPLFLPEVNPSEFGMLRGATDRNYLPGRELFLKRKFMTNSNAKNFLSGSLAEQSDYFDELEQRVEFPEIFPCSQISCALLEKALSESHDFERNPMVYTSHKISVDRHHLLRLRSNDVLHILVETPGAGSGPAIHAYHCYGVVGEDHLLFRAIIELAPLESILRNSRTGVVRQTIRDARPATTSRALKPTLA